MDNKEKMALLDKFSEGQLEQLMLMMKIKETGEEKEEKKQKEIDATIRKGEFVFYEEKRYLVSSVSKSKKMGNLKDPKGGKKILIKNALWDQMIKVDEKKINAELEAEENEEEEGVFVPSNSLKGDKGRVVPINYKRQNGFIDDMKEALDDIEDDKKLSVVPLKKRNVRKTGALVDVRCPSCGLEETISPVFATPTYKCNACLVSNR